MEISASPRSLIDFCLLILCEKSRVSYLQHEIEDTNSAGKSSESVNVNVCEALISEKPLSEKLRGPYMWKAIISDNGSAKCIWSLSLLA